MEREKERETGTQRQREMEKERERGTVRQREIGEHLTFKVKRCCT